MNAYKVRGNEGWEVVVAESFDKAKDEYKRVMEDVYEMGKQEVWKIHLLGEILNVASYKKRRSR